MLVIYHATQLEQLRKSAQWKGKRIGFVPTMGALHEGHKSLVKASLSQCDITISSIFVNPTQFNDPGDLEKYPRDIESDLEDFACTGCDIAFVPEVGDIYPPGLDTTPDIDFGGLISTMEGKYRPGHFEGVAQVVKRLLDIVQPHFLFMGQKDFQQVAVVSHMVKTLGIQVEVVRCPTVREDDGLAMSSRNALLTPDLRSKASVLYETLMQAKSMLAKGESLEEIRSMASDTFDLPGFALEYFEIADGYTLQPVKSSGDADFLVACIAAYAGDVRLIDNMVLKE